MAAMAWPDSLYHLDRGVGLAVCVAHHGEHVWQSLTGDCMHLQEPPRRGRYQPCAKHDGRHQDVSGQCVHWGARYALRPGRCLACAAPTMNRLDLQTGRVSVLEEGSDDVHAHPAIVVQQPDLDPRDLAAAIVIAARELRGERIHKPEPPAAPEPASEHPEPVPTRRRLIDAADEP